MSEEEKKSCGCGCSCEESKEKNEPKAPPKRMGIVQEFMLFMKENKAYWMAPILIVLAVLILFVVLAPTYAPGIYTLF